MQKVRFPAILLASLLAVSANVALGEGFSDPYEELYCYKNQECSLESPAPPNNEKNVGVSFPENIDRSSVIIKFWRFECGFAGCNPPPYEVTISGDGTIIFIGNQTAVAGTHRDHITNEALDRLIEKFRAADFFTLPAKMDNFQDWGKPVVIKRPDGKQSIVRKGEPNDVPERVISLSLNGITKHVVHYAMNDSKSDDILPKVQKQLSITELEDEIDKIAGTNKWVRGTPEVIDSLKREGFDFDSPISRDITFGLILHNNIPVLEAFLAAGATLQNDYPNQWALMIANSLYRHEMVDFLKKSGVEELVPKSQ